MSYAYLPSLDQFSVEEIRCELLKCLAGLTAAPGETLYTAAWGCGTFGGHLELKLLIQLLAFGLTVKSKMMFEKDYCLRFSSVDGNGPKLLAALSDRGVTTYGRLWEVLMSYSSLSREERQNISLFDAIFITSMRDD